MRYDEKLTLGARITRMAPGDQHLRIDLETAGQFTRLEAVVTRRDTDETTVFPLNSDHATHTLTPLWNGVEYQVEIKTDGVAACAPRLFRLGYVPGTVVNYIHPEDHAYMPSGRSTGAPSLLRLQNGTLLASHNCFWGDAAQNLTLVFSSNDGGESWRFLSYISPCTWGTLFAHKGAVYMLGVAGEYGALVLFRSADEGARFSPPVQLMPPGSVQKGGPHKAPMPVLEHQGRLWTVIDYGSWKIPEYHKNGFISIDADADLMDNSQWVCSGFLGYDPSWSGVANGHSEGCVEGNALVTPDGQLVDFTRYETRKCEPCKGLALMLQMDPTDPAGMPSFYKAVRFPGNLSKFKVAFDDQSGRYFALVSRCVSDYLRQRNLLTLVSSADLEDWRIERDILNFEDNGWPEDSRHVAFQYVDWQIDGEDMLALSRTSINGAFNYHNANHMTFYRIHNFRDRGY